MPEVARFYGLEVNRAGMTCCLFHDDKSPSPKSMTITSTVSAARSEQVRPCNGRLHGVRSKAVRSEQVRICCGR